MLKDLLWHKRHLPDAIFASGTVEANADFEGIFPPSFVFEGYEPDMLQNFLSRQRRINKKRNQLGLDKKRSACILDDCGFDKDFTKDPVLRNIFMNGRHFGIFFAFTLQYCMDMKIDLRTQIDYVFVMKEDVVSVRQRLYKEYAGRIGTYETFCHTLNEYTKDFKCLVIKNSGSTPTIQDKFFWYKAENRGPYRFGSPEYWTFHDEHYNQDWDDEEDMLLLDSSYQNNGRGRNSKKQVIVRKVNMD